MAKQAKFFCEFCDSEVPYNAKICPTCGHFFLSVRCPVCGKTGSHKEFTNGCPQCGYAFNGDKSTAPQTTPEQITKKTGFGKEKHFFNDDDSKARGRRSSDALPLWIYAATFVVFAGIIILFYNLLK